MTQNEFEYQKFATTLAKCRLIGQMLAENGVERGLVMQYQLNALQRACPEDEELIKDAKVVAGFSHPAQTQYLNPTRIGKEFGKITGKILKATEVNQRLQRLGLQRKVDQDWDLTEAGREFGQLFPYENNGHSGFQLRWSPNVIDRLVKDEI